MRFAVGDIDHTFAVDENAVRPRGLAMERIAIGAVAALAGADDGGDDAAFQIDAADRMALGVGNVDATVRRPGNTFRAVQFSLARVAAFSVVAFLSGPCQMLEAAGSHVYLVDSVPFAQSQVKIALRVEIDGSRSVDRSPR